MPIPLTIPSPRSANRLAIFTVLALSLILVVKIAQSDAPGDKPVSQTPPAEPKKLDWEIEIKSVLEPLSKKPLAENVRQLIEEQTILLQAKYLRHPRALLAITFWARSAYESLNDLNAAAVVALDHRSEYAKIIMNQAIRHARAICDQADAYRDLKQTDTALACYAEVLDFPLGEPPYCDHARLAEFNEILTRATMATLELTPIDEVYAVKYLPEHLARIENAFPEKSARLLRANTLYDVGTKIFLVKRILSHATSEDTPPEMKAHCQALVEFVKQGGY